MSSDTENFTPASDNGGDPSPAPKAKKTAQKKTARKATKKTARKAATKRAPKAEQEAPAPQEAKEENKASVSSPKDPPHPKGNGRRPQHSRPDRKGKKQGRKEKVTVFTGPELEIEGLLEIAPKGFGFLRVQSKNYTQCREDVFVTPETIRKLGLRLGSWVKGIYRQGQRGPQLIDVQAVNGEDPDKARKTSYFEELRAINPDKRIALETSSDCATTRIIDIMAPIGKGQRGLIVAPPRAGKTTVLMHVTEALIERHSETIHPIVLLIDERPEEVTEFKRKFPDIEIYASSNDDPVRNHCRLAELCIERSKRLVESGKDVFIVMDSITRLARAYNNNMQGGKGRGVQSGGIIAGALETPRRLFAAARNTKEAGSLTILATSLIQTNSRADEAIFQEFKGTGNMELVLDRRIAEHYVYPAVDIFKSGTRREELILPDISLRKIHMIRRGLAGHKPTEAMERLLFFIKKFPNNAQMLLEIKG